MRNSIILLLSLLLVSCRSGFESRKHTSWNKGSNKHYVQKIKQVPDEVVENEVEQIEFYSYEIADLKLKEEVEEDYKIEEIQIQDLKVHEGEQTGISSLKKRKGSSLQPKNNTELIFSRKTVYNKQKSEALKVILGIVLIFLGGLTALMFLIALTWGIEIWGIFIYLFAFSLFIGLGIKLLIKGISKKSNVDKYPEDQKDFDSSNNPKKSPEKFRWGPALLGIGLFLALLGVIIGLSLQ